MVAGKTTIAVLVAANLCACFDATSSVRLEDALKAVKLDDTSLCFPASYSPDTRFMDWYLKPIADQLDSSEGSELIYVPADVIRDRVPRYELNHVNAIGVTYAHDLRGIASASSGWNSPPSIYARDAWTSRSQCPNCYMENDTRTEFVRVYGFAEKVGPFDLVKTRPPFGASHEPPTGWWIGSCSESDFTGHYSCRQYVQFKSVIYEYELEIQDIDVRHEVRAAVLAMLDEWNTNCDDS